MAETSWQRGRFDARDGPHKLLFGQTYEDGSIELGAFHSGARVFCIAGGGDTAIQLAARHEVVAVDINPAQVAYVGELLAGAPRQRGSAERILAFVQALGPLAGWWQSRLRDFLELVSTTEQVSFWRRHLDTRRFRVAFDLLLSLPALRSIYAPSFLRFLPTDLGAILRRRMERGFSLHPNRSNPYARALLLGEMSPVQPLSEVNALRLVCADAASFLEGEPAQSFHGFALSNILDGASAGYAQRLVTALKRAAAPGAMVVLRSFREPRSGQLTNRAEIDRAMIWGVVDIRPAVELNGIEQVFQTRHG